MSGDSLAVSGAVRIDGFGDVARIADVLAKAEGFVPRQYLGRPPAIAAAILTGIELGMGPMESIRAIHIIEGKPTMSAELMLARARRAGVRTRWLETSATVARLAVMVPGDTEWQVMAWTWEDAQRAGVAGKDNWKRHPAAMLRARCTSAAMRAFCPEYLGAGVYESSSGELTGGEPIEAVAVRVEAAPAALPAESSGDAVAREVEAIRELLEAADSAEQIQAARGRAKLIGRRLSAEQKATMASAAQAAEARLAATVSTTIEGD